jgi:hypothetical protein
MLMPDFQKSSSLFNEMCDRLQPVFSERLCWRFAAGGIEPGVQNFQAELVEETPRKSKIMNFFFGPERVNVLLGVNDGSHGYTDLGIFVLDKRILDRYSSDELEYIRMQLEIITRTDLPIQGLVFG